MLVTIDILIVIPLVFLCFGALAFTAMFFMQLQKDAPEAFKIRNARRKKTGLVFLHHPNGTFEICTPKYDNRSDVGYWAIKDGLYKYKDVSGTNTERMSGDLPIHHVLDNLPEPISVLMAAHMSVLADIFNEQGHSLDGIEKIFFYVLTEIFNKEDLVAVDFMVKTSTGGTRKATWTDLNLDQQITEILHRLENTLTDIGVNDEVTREKLRAIIPYIMKNRDQLENAVHHLRPRAFSFQTVIRAIDNLVAFTSSNWYNAKQVIEADAKNNRGFKDYMPILVVGFAVFIILVGAGFLFK